MELKVENKIFNYMKVADEDYISITNMIKSKGGNFFVTYWLRNRNTIEFLVFEKSYIIQILIMANSP